MRKDDSRKHRRILVDLLDCLLTAIIGFFVLVVQEICERNILEVCYLL